MEATFGDTGFLKGLFATVNKTYGNFNIDFCNEGMYIGAMCGSHVSMLDVASNANMFSKLICPKGLTLGFNNEALMELDKNIKIEDTVTLRCESNDDKVTWKIQSPDSKIIIMVKMKLMDIDVERLNIPNRTPEVVFSLPSKDYKDLMTRFGDKADSFVIIVRRTQVIFRVKTSISEYDILYKVDPTTGKLTLTASVGEKRSRDADNNDDDNETEEGDDCNSSPAKKSKVVDSSDDESDDDNLIADEDDEGDDEDASKKSKKPTKKAAPKKKATAKPVKPVKIPRAAVNGGLQMIHFQCVTRTATQKDVEIDLEQPETFTEVVTPRTHEMQQSFGPKYLRGFAESAKLRPRVEFFMYDDNPMAVVFRLQSHTDPDADGGHLRHFVAAVDEDQKDDD